MQENCKEYNENILVPNNTSRYEAEISAPELNTPNTQDALHQNLRIYSYLENYQLTKELVKLITNGILFDQAISTFMDIEEDESLTETSLLEGENIIMTLNCNSDIADIGTRFNLTLDKLVLGFRLWSKKSHEYLVEQTIQEYLSEQPILISKAKEIKRIDEIGICEIIQYALFNRPLYQNDVVHHADVRNET